MRTIVAHVQNAFHVAAGIEIAVGDTVYYLFYAKSVGVICVGYVLIDRRQPSTVCQDMVMPR